MKFWRILKLLSRFRNSFKWNGANHVSSESNIVFVTISWEKLSKRFSWRNALDLFAFWIEIRLQDILFIGIEVMPHNLYQSALKIRFRYLEVYI